MKKLLTVIAILLIATPAYPKTYTIDRVISGDIIKLTNGKIVRLLGIDTPESEYDAEMTGLNVETILRIKQEARDYLTDYINQLPSKEVFLEFDVEKKDKFSQSRRWQAYVFWDTGFGENDPLDIIIEANQHFDYFDGRFRHFINATMIKAGYATPMSFEPNVKYRELFEELYLQAQEYKRGLWMEPQPPREEVKTDSPEEEMARESPEIESEKEFLKEEFKEESIIKEAIEETVKEKKKTLVKEPAREEKEYYDNGTLKLHMVLFNEEDFHGFWREYYEDGMLKVDVKLLKVKGGCSDAGGIPIEGLAREFYINGQLKQAGEYKNNCEEGIHKYYSHEGALEEELYYQQGKHLWTKYYDSNGQVYSEDHLPSSEITGLPVEEGETSSAASADSALRISGRMNPAK